MNRQFSIFNFQFLLNNQIVPDVWSNGVLEIDWKLVFGNRYLDTVVTP